MAKGDYEVTEVAAKTLFTEGFIRCLCCGDDGVPIDENPPLREQQPSKHLRAWNVDHELPQQHCGSR